MVGKLVGKWGREFFVKFGKEYDRQKKLEEPKFWWIKIFPWIRIGILWTRNINSKEGK